MLETDWAALNILFKDGKNSEFNSLNGARWNAIS